MIEKVSVKFSAPVFQANGQNFKKSVYSKQINENNSNSRAYLLAALGGLGVVGLACLFPKNEMVRSAKNVVKNGVKKGQEVINTAIKKTGVNKKPAGTLETNVPAKKQNLKPVKEDPTHNVINDIDVQHLSSDKRQIVKNAGIETVSAEQQAEYSKNIAFQPMKPEQKTAAIQLAKRNKKQRQKNNAIGARLPESIVEKLNGLFPKVSKNNQKTKLIPLYPNGFTKYTA